MMMLSAAALVFCGALLLCIAMDRHQSQVLMAKLSRHTGHLLRLFATLLLGAGYLVTAAVKGWAIGGVAWILLCTAAILVLVLLLTYMPRLLPRIGLAALAISGLSGLFILL